MKFNLFQNKYVLYVIAFLSIVNILGYFMDRNYGAVTFFTLVAFLTLYFSKNMIIVLGVALLSTNLLGGLAEIFMQVPPPPVRNNENKNTKEGFENNNEKVNLDIEGTIVKTPGGSKFEPSAFSESIKQNNNTKDISVKFDKSKDFQDKTDFLQTQITADNIKEIEKKTQLLLKEQNDMMKQISDFGPLLNNSLQAIGNITTGNIGSIVNELTTNLDALYEKYPQSFPSDYKETSNNMKQVVNKASLEQKKLKEAMDKDPAAAKKILELQETIQINN